MPLELKKKSVYKGQIIFLKEKKTEAFSMVWWTQCYEWQKQGSRVTVVLSELSARVPHTAFHRFFLAAK